MIDWRMVGAGLECSAPRSTQPGDPLKNSVPHSILTATGAGIPSSITDRSRTAGAPDVSWSSQSVITIGDPFRKEIALLDAGVVSNPGTRD